MSNPSKDDGITVSTATAADLDALAQIQFAAFAQEAHQHVLGGADTPANRAAAAARHAADLCANPGLVIAKATLHPGGPIAGYCMFYFPDEGAATAAERVPTPLRPQSDDLGSDAGGSQDGAEADTAVDGIQGGQQAESKALGDLVRQFIRQEIRNHVKDRECVYVRYMCVEPAYQRRGVGKALMAWACARFDRLGVDTYLEASALGEGLYRQFGFEIIGRSEKDFGSGLHIEYAHMWRKARKLDGPL